ncbi:MAG TPA: alpha/beta fold hydrolase [Devosia sp.]|nr:alpha/beta fold hydrolase [Devosia sp.]
MAIRRSLLAGLLFGLAALVIAPAIGLSISSDVFNDDGQVTWFNLFIGAGACGALMWCLLSGLPRAITLVRGGMAGILAGLLSYPVVIAFAELLQRQWSDLPPLLERLEQIQTITTLTLITTGFPGVLLMAVSGMIIALLLKRLHPLSTARTSPERPAIPRIALGLSLLAVIALGITFFWFETAELDAPPIATPAEEATMTYEQAMAAFASVEERESGLDLDPLCHSRLLSHGSRTARTVVYFHGFTSCPAQADALAEQLLALGYNVYLPRMHGHGLASPNPGDLDDFTAEGLMAHTSAAIDLAQGLGDDVTVMGLSAGGTLSAWAAQFREDVDGVVLISPFFGPYVVPTWAMQAGTNVTRALPNISFSWNPLENATPEKAAISHAMPTTYALTEIMLVGWQIHAAAQTSPPAVSKISILLNDADVAVNNRQTLEIAAYWQEHGVTPTVTTLPFSARLPHDLVNTRERGANVDLVYPALLELLARR